MTPFWLRSFTTERDSSFFREDAPAIRRDLQKVRDILDESKDSILSIEPVTNTTPPSEHDWTVRAPTTKTGKLIERICWSTVVVLIVWLGWAAMHAALSAPN